MEAGKGVRIGEVGSYHFCPSVAAPEAISKFSDLTAGSRMYVTFSFESRFNAMQSEFSREKSLVSCGDVYALIRTLPNYSSQEKKNNKERFLIPAVSRHVMSFFLLDFSCGFCLAQFEFIRLVSVMFVFLSE